MTPRRLPDLDPSALGQGRLVLMFGAGGSGGLGSTNVGAVSDNGTSEPGDGTDNSGTPICPSPLLFDHVFPAPGTYAVTLTLTDDAGAEHHTTRSIKVMRGGYIEFEQLEGMTGGAPTGSSVFRTSLEQWATLYGSAQLGTLVAIDNSPWE
ncbi:MAG: PKD domain-containing protein, partial [Gammaproteobacteria bacterium]|nr:PKD domain-containing protein [Gammaproteobacteria bacterium]